MSLNDILTSNIGDLPVQVAWANFTMNNLITNDSDVKSLTVHGESDLNVLNVDTLSTNHFNLATGDLISGYVLTSDTAGNGVWKNQIKGDTGAQGMKGDTGARGNTGPKGDTGATGSPSGLSYADYFALMPGDNSSTVATGGRVQFPQDGIVAGSNITRFSSTQIGIAAGTYEVHWQVSVSEAGQLVLDLSGTPLLSSTAGRATGTDQIVGMCIVQVGSASRIGIMNPAGNAAALTITPIAGGTLSASAHLLIRQLA